MTECETIKSITSGKTLTVFLEGDVDHHNARQIRSRIDTKVYIQRPDELVLDLSRVNFMDSSGLGLIMGRIALMRELSGEAVLKNPTDKVLRIVRLSGLERMIKIIFDCDEGENGYANKGQ